ncbi:efflux RND transporter periplasmic adaptor subunit [Flaviaesturariibacter amylovorans]|uniref:Efflux RND transporter periplasmic adaptor subunit n=1 Tax=Flaviaesturariibacter amylovorans TaxID=1084520 RepID=A0ABP8HKV2_9BACT
MRIFFSSLVLLLLFWGSSCESKKTPQAETAAKKQTYTCPMHPQIVRTEPGTCPICGMDLVPFDKTNQEKSLTLGRSQQMLANIQTMAVGTGNLSTVTRLNARLTVSPEGTRFVSARVAGRIDQLSVRQTGDPVRKGQVLYRIYSEQLQALQQEYLVLAAQAAAFPSDARFRELAYAARQKLLLYGQAEGQVQKLLQSKKVDPNVIYLAPASGIVAELSVTEGQYVAEGGPIMKLESYQQVWVEADVYPREAERIRNGQRVQVLVAGSEEEPEEMVVSFVTPAVQTNTQVVQIRGTISNRGGRFQPGMQVVVLLPGEKSAGSKLTLPIDAVIRDGNKAHVWLQVDREKFVPKPVTTGAETAEQVEILTGLTAGEKVVTSGAYLLYSEYILKKGKNPVDANQ